MALCTAGYEQFSPAIVSDGAGGAIVTWQDYRTRPGGPFTSGYADIYARRVSAAGAPQWTDDGVALCTTAGYDQTHPTIASDGAGGAIVTWSDARSGPHAQRVSAAGAPQWTADGVALSTAADPITSPRIVPDGAGGAIVTWSNIFFPAPGVYGGDIHAQRLSAAGAPQWTAYGVQLNTNGHGLFPTIISDGGGGAIVTWSETRPWPDANIYAQRVHGSGAVVAVPPSSASAHFQLLAPFPNPWRDGQLRIAFNLPSSERVSAEVFDLAGHRVRTLATDREFSSGAQALGWDGRNDDGVGLPTGVYFVKVRAGTHAEARRAILLH